MALPPRRSAFPVVNVRYADKIPALPRIQPCDGERAARSDLWKRARVPLAAGGEDLPQRHGLVRHDAVHAQVKQSLHGGLVVNCPSVYLQAKRV